MQRRGKVSVSNEQKYCDNSLHRYTLPSRASACRTFTRAPMKSQFGVKARTPTAPELVQVVTCKAVYLCISYSSFICNQSLRIALFGEFVPVYLCNQDFTCVTDTSSGLTMSFTSACDRN